MADYDEIKKLFDEAKEIEAAYMNACNVTGEARRNETALLNQLNEKQKNINAAMTKIRSQAPRDSDWKIQDRKVEAVHP
jgi:hypothetical protein